MSHGFIFVPAEVLQFRVAAITPTIDLRDQLKRSIAAEPANDRGRKLSDAERDQSPFHPSTLVN